MLAHARNVTINDGNFGTVHGNQYNNRYNGPISKRHVTHVYGDTFHNSTIRRTSRNGYNRPEVRSEFPDDGAVTIFRPHTAPSRPESPRSHISVANHLARPSSSLSGSSIPYTPAEQTRHNITYVPVGAIAVHPADEPAFDSLPTFSPSHRSERPGDNYPSDYYTPDEGPHQGDRLAAASFHSHFSRPTSVHSGHTNNSRKEALGTQPSLESSLRNTQAWLRQTEPSSQHDRPPTPPTESRTRTPEQHPVPSQSDHAPSETPTSYRENPSSERNWEADDEHESLARYSDYPESEVTSFCRVPSEQNWDADDEYASQGSDRGTVLMRRANPKVHDLVNRIVEMGFTRREVVRCMKASNGDPELAVEYLTNGISSGTKHKSQLV